MSAHELDARMMRDVERRWQRELLRDESGDGPVLVDSNFGTGVRDADPSAPRGDDEGAS